MIATPLMRLTADEVLRIARLASLDLNPADVERLRGQLSGILALVEKLNKLDVSAIEPTAHAIFVPTPLREDRVERFERQEEVLSNAPEREGTFFRVPKVI